MTALDNAHAAMEADPDDDARRVAFYACLAGTELYLLLKETDLETPRLFNTADGSFLLVFDREDRLTEFTGGPAPYAALSGRAVAQMVGGQQVGVGLNLGVAPSSFLIPAEAVSWLDDALGNAPAELTGTPTSVAPPKGLPESLLTAIDTKLATAQGLASAAYLVAVTYQDNRRGHLLAIIDAIADAQPAIARAVSEAVIFSGIDAGELDVAFVASTNPIVASLAKAGIRFDLPKPPRSKPPGADPAKPPKLR